MRLTGLAIGPDGRNRCLISVFQSVPGRNQPSNSKFIFGPARWMRGLIKPPPGYAVAYVDWKSQEIAIAAALSGMITSWKLIAPATSMSASQTGRPDAQFGDQRNVPAVRRDPRSLQDDYSRHRLWMGADAMAVELD